MAALSSVPAEQLLPATPPPAAECRFEEAASCLDSCSPATFQPTQLFPLFPAYTSAWASEVPLQQQQQYWGLHASLASLDALIDRHLGGSSGSIEGGEAHAAGGSPPAGGQQQQRDSSAAAAADEEGGGRPPQNGGQQPPAAGEQLEERQRLQRRAWEAIAQYLFRVRLLLRLRRCILA